MYSTMYTTKCLNSWCQRFQKKKTEADNPLTKKPINKRFIFNRSKSNLVNLIEPNQLIMIKSDNFIIFFYLIYKNNILGPNNAETKAQPYI